MTRVTVIPVVIPIKKENQVEQVVRRLRLILNLNTILQMATCGDHRLCCMWSAIHDPYETVNFWRCTNQRQWASINEDQTCYRESCPLQAPTSYHDQCHSYIPTIFLFTSNVCLSRRPISSDIFILLPPALLCSYPPTLPSPLPRSAQ